MHPSPSLRRTGAAALSILAVLNFRTLDSGFDVSRSK
jgi:hypothetical protein